jgi:hypothetical protein
MEALTDLFEKAPLELDLTFFSFWLTTHPAKVGVVGIEF